ncbi:MAG: helix-turn-helix domain containing protein [Chloroflexi bacterium]|nr:helix-turn-helix domain containing protein [Chloroflexota bacterium]
MVRSADINRREVILRAAREVFKERGYENAHMDDIARLAGIAKGTVYLYFESKLALLEALVDSYYSMMVDAISPSLTNVNSKAALKEAVHAAFDLASQERDLVVLLDLRLGLTRKQEAIGNPMAMKDIRHFLKGCRDRDELRGYDPVIAAVLVGGLIQWITKFCLVWHHDDISRYEETAIRMLQFSLFKNFKEDDI